MDGQRRVELPRSRTAAAVARGCLADWYGDALDGSTLYSAQLIATEFATNAFLHGTGAIEMRALLDQDRLLVEVIDEGSGFERTARREDFDALGGRGLTIVNAEASRWGIHEGTTHIWFELERPGPRVGSDQQPKP